MLFRRSVVEAKLAFLEEEIEVLARNAVVFAQDLLGLVPKILDTVDMMSLRVDEGFGVIDVKSRAIVTP